MSAIIITSITRNPGATSQQYLIQLRALGDVLYTDGPTLSYDQAQSTPAGVLPLAVPIPDAWVGLDKEVEVRIVTVCGSGSLASGNNISLVTTPTSCGPR